MPYCPRCDLEFVEGITECTECHGPLIESKELAEPNRIPVFEESESECERISEFLRYSGIEDIKIDSDNLVNACRVLVPEKEYRQAVKLVQVYYQNEHAEEIAQAEKEQAEAVGDKPAVFVSKRTKLEDVKSSASSFLLVGGIVLIADLLWIFGILKLPMLGNNIVMKITMAAMAVVFLIIGISSYRSIGKLSAEADKEDEQHSDIMSRFLSTYNRGEIDADIRDNQPDTFDDPTLLEFARLDLIKTRLIEDFELTDEVQAEAMVEELYQKMYEN